MSEEIKAKQTRAKKVDFKIAKGDYDIIENYARSINSTPTKVVNGWIKQHLQSEEVKKALEKDEELIQWEKDLEKKDKEVARKKKETAEAQREADDLRAKIKAKKDSKKQS